jgi:formylglycine-generating enzyme required for sulfatase activity
VNVVNWHDAVAFCRWASEKTGLHVRLPTAAEWQKAARGTDGRPYPWGDTPEPNSRLCNCLPPVGRSGKTQQGDTTPVGGYSPRGDSPYGCTDMLGNVWEWTSSRADGEEMLDGNLRPFDSRADRLLFGGSFMSDYASVDCVAARVLNPLRARDTGFRVCVSS